MMSRFLTAPSPQLVDASSLESDRSYRVPQEGLTRIQSRVSTFGIEWEQ